MPLLQLTAHLDAQVSGRRAAQLAKKICLAMLSERTTYCKVLRARYGEGRGEPPHPPTGNLRRRLPLLPHGEDFGLQRPDELMVAVLVVHRRRVQTLHLRNYFFSKQADTVRQSNVKREHVSCT